MHSVRNGGISSISCFRQVWWRMVDPKTRWRTDTEHHGSLTRGKLLVKSICDGGLHRHLCVRDPAVSLISIC